MAVEATDMIFFLSANRPENDTDISGGAIDSTMRLLDRTNTESINDQIDLVSSAAGDTQNCVVAGYAPDGTWLEETVALNGVSHVQTVGTFLHLRKVQLASAAVGTITVAKYAAGVPVTIFTIPITEKGQVTLFLKAAAEAVGGASKNFYEKVFLQNTHATDALINAVLWMSEDENAQLTLDCEESANVTVTNGTETTTNRVTEPTTGGTYAWGEHATQGTAHACGDAEDGNLAASERQGTWIKMTLAAGAAPDKSVFVTMNEYGEAT